jgi:tRNA uridine 5-carboxymethylaminomethyl modification enzyme
MLSARELLRRPEVRYYQVASLVKRVAVERDGSMSPEALPSLSEEAMEEVEVQVKYENYVRKQEQMVHRTLKLEEMRIPEMLNYQNMPHLRTEARQKLMCALPRTVGQASRIEGVTPADIAILMIYLEKKRALKVSS